MTGNRGTGTGGFSLVELIVGVGVFSIALLALISALVSGQQLDSFTRERTAATLEAQSRMEDVLAQDWTTIDSRNNETFAVDFPLSTNATNKLKPGGGRTLPGLVTITSPMADLRRVQVSVVWTSSAAAAGGGLSTGRVEMTTFVGRH